MVSLLVDIPDITERERMECCDTEVRHSHTQYSDVSVFSWIVAWDRAHLFHAIKESVLPYRVVDKSLVELNDMAELILTEFFVINDTTEFPCD